MLKSDKLVEATMLALQGKLELKENKSNNKRADKFIKDYFQHKYDLETLHNKLAPLFNSKKDAVEYLVDNENRIKKELKKTEGIDVNVDDTTTVSVDSATTVVNTEDATIIIEEPAKEPETSIEAPADIPTVEPELPVPVSDEPETIEVPAEDTVMPEDVLEPVDTELPEDEDDEPSIDEMIDESKKIKGRKLESNINNGAYGYFTDTVREVAQNLDNLNGNTKYQDAIKNDKQLELVIDSIMDDDELWNCLQETITYYIDELIKGNLREGKKVESRKVAEAKACSKIKAKRLKAKRKGKKVEDKGEVPEIAYEVAEKIAKIIRRKGILSFNEVDNLIEALSGWDWEKIVEEELITDVYGCLNYEGIDQNTSTGDFYTYKYGNEHPEVKEESKKVEDTEAELSPKYAGVKSFYGKAKVVTKDNGDEELYSYGTHVGGMRGGKPYSKGRFSQTTSRHQKEYFRQKGVDDKDISIEEGKTCKNCDKEVCECDTKLEALRTKSRANRSAKIQEMKSRRVKKSEALNRLNRTVSKRRQMLEHKKLNESIEEDLKINEGTPKKEEEVPNTVKANLKVENKFSSKSFNKVLTEYYNKQYKTIESVNVSKIYTNKSGDLKIEAKITHKNKAIRNICLEMVKIQNGTAFSKYVIKEAKGLKEAKGNDTKLTMMTYKNKHNVLECKYIVKK